LLLVLVSAFILGSESRGTRGHILLSQIRDFPFYRLLRLAGLRWRYSTPPPHGIDLVWQTPHVLLPSTDAYRTPNSRVQFLVSVVTVRLCTRCLGNVHEPLPSKVDSYVCGSAIPAFRRCLLSRCLSMDAWLRLHRCGFQASCRNIFVKLLTLFFLW
jgi:hypothetical protein